MESPTGFICPNCDSEMEVPDPQELVQVECRTCQAIFKLHFSEPEQAWVLEMEEPVESGEETQHDERPFSVLSEVGRPKREDRSERHREETDIHQDEDIAAEMPRK